MRDPGVKVRVLIADDSPTMRAALSALLSEDPRLEVVGDAADGAEAVRLCRLLHPDVVTMDVSMPGLDGLGATQAIMADHPARVLIICAVSEAEQLDLSFQAIAAGALELIAKPGPGSGRKSDPGLRRFGREIADAVALMAEVPVVRRPLRGPVSPHAAKASRRPIDVLGIAASTGGPPALAAILGSLPPRLPFAILVAQHIADGFTAGLRRWLSAVSPLPVSLAQDGVRCEPGTVWLAPDHCDLVLEPGLILRTPPASGPHRPSGNLLLASLASSFGPRAAGLVLTGMGDDGAQGLLQLRRAGGRCLAQDEQTSVVFGMPQAARDLGATEQLLPLEEIASRIVELA
jgi:two-component system, chemotaxis family, protein-glutamate methylesterase/glutaminase